MPDIDEIQAGISPMHVFVARGEDIISIKMPNVKPVKGLPWALKSP